VDTPPPYSVPKEFVSLPAMAELLASEQKKLNGPGIHDDWRSLRDQSQKPLREAWHAYMFGTCYAHFHEIPYGGMFMKPEAEEYSFRDATLMWGTPGEVRQMNLQLKELPPEHRNAKVQLEHILYGVSRKYHAAYDLVVAIFLNREQRIETVPTPPLEIAELWLFGFMDSGLTKIFLKGMTRAGHVSHVVPWKLTS